jgi:hypothetical protein
MLLQLQVFMGVRPCSTDYSWKVLCNLQLTLVVVYAGENEPSFTYVQQSMYSSLLLTTIHLVQVQLCFEGVQ